MTETQPTGALSEVAILRSAMLFSLTRHTWSNRRKADKSKVVTTGDAKRLNLTKELLDSPELDAINAHLNDVYGWALARSMPSTAIRRGIYFVKRTMVGEFEERLSAARAELRDNLVPAFLATYDARRERMKLPTGLGDLYLESDYPATERLTEMFSIQWSWLALSVPEELPEEVRDREVRKLRDSFLEAQEEIKYALRAGFKAMVEHAVDRLTVGVGERPKVFRDSMIDNFREFFATFEARNLMEDEELARVVAQAKAVVAGLPQDVAAIRDVPDIRSAAAERFAQLSTALGSLVIEKPSRKFDLED